MAIDQASINLINETPVNSSPLLAELEAGDVKFALTHAKKGKEGNVTLATNHIVQLQKAEEMGVDSKEYEFKNIEKKED